MSQRALSRCTALLQHEKRRAAGARDPNARRRRSLVQAHRADSNIIQRGRPYSTLSWDVEESETLDGSHKTQRKSSKSTSQDAAAELRAFVDKRRARSGRKANTARREDVASEAPFSSKEAAAELKAFVTQQRAQSGVATSTTPEAETTSTIASAPQIERYEPYEGDWQPIDDVNRLLGGEVAEARAPTIAEAHEELRHHLATGVTAWQLPVTIGDSKLMDVKYAEMLPIALSRQEPDMAARCVVAANYAHDFEFIKSISDKDYSKIFDLLRPALFAQELITHHHYYLKPARINYWGLIRLSDIAIEYEKILKTLMKIRRENQCKLQLVDYEAVLEAAQDLHHRSLAEHAWTCLHEDGHSPSVKCYNGYVAAIMFPHPIYDGSHMHDRITPYKLYHRRAENFEDYFCYQVGPGGVLSTSNRHFSDMQQKGLRPDVLSYTHLITASAMEGRIDGVAAVLKSIYLVDVHSLSTKQGQEQPPRQLAEDDPLYPTEKLLYAATRAYCTNNQITTAIQLLQYMTTHYNLNASKRVWAMVLEWGHVLSRERPFDRPSRSKGQVAKSTMEKLWKVMTEPPYSISLSVEMYDYIVRAALSAAVEYPEPDVAIKLLPMALRAMYDGKRQHRHIRNERNSAWKLFGTLVENEAARFKSEQSGKSLEWAARHAELAQLAYLRSMDLMSTWLFKVLDVTEYTSQLDLSAHHTAVQIPKIIQFWQEYSTANYVEYDTPTGHVDIILRSPDEREARKKAHKWRADKQEKFLRKVPRMIDDCWYTNHASYERGVINDFPHTHKQMPGVDKRIRGLRRPENSMRDGVPFSVPITQYIDPRSLVPSGFL